MTILQKANKALQEERLGTAMQGYKEALERYPELHQLVDFNYQLARKKAFANSIQFLHTKNQAQLLATRFPLRILFVLPGPFNSNNGYHVQLFARMLERCGVQCIVAVPDRWHTGEANGTRSYSSVQADDKLMLDLIHAWTPREIVRALCDSLDKRHRCPIVVHLEDNEEYLTEVMTGRSCAELRISPLEEVDKLVPENCYHPVRGRLFLDKACGLTMIIETLRSFIKPAQPHLVLAPPVDEQLFFPRPLNTELRKAMGIADSSVAFAYTGNVHRGNKDEVEELYKAVALLNERGHAAVLLRTGADTEGLGTEYWDKRYEKHLGWVDRRRVPEILAAANILVQPGQSGSFNDLRIPCKLPEYFAMGRPIILPKTNIGLLARHGEEAYVLEKADAVHIVSAVMDIMDDNTLKDHLSEGSVGFYQRIFGRHKSASLLDFYLNL
jgi:glycosyltransferase involved in cell wall biosynthesis